VKIFISYSRQDRDPKRAEFAHGDLKIVNKLITFLTDCGYDIWIDSAALKGAQNWEVEIAKAIRASNSILCFGSPNWRQSEYCSKELQIGLAHGKPVLPILLAHDPELPSVFRERQFVDFTQGIGLRALGKFVAGLRQVEAQSADIVKNILGAPFEWVEVPAGEVELVDLRGRSLPDFPCNGPDGGVRQVQPFAISMYPITVEQFEVFIERSDGYGDPSWWDFSRKAQDWRAGEGAKPQSPAYHGVNLPRTNVAWYDAVAFCRWLSVTSGEDIRLPTEAEWQWAAQGSDGRAYPWGSFFEQKRCNYIEIAPQSETDYAPSAVDQYRAGSSPFGVMDLCGNVWEWTRTGLKCSLPTTSASEEVQALDADVMRMMRGGSGKRAPGEQHKLTTTYREELDRPGRRSRSRGFRIVRYGR
jgi:formylglycine-generating enzyme required for sulfatase activity